MAIPLAPAELNNGAIITVPTNIGALGQVVLPDGNGNWVHGALAYSYVTGTPSLGSAAFVNLSVLLQSSLNLSDLTNAATARTNLQLGTAAHTNSYLDLSNQLVNGAGLTLTGTTLSITNSITPGSVGDASTIPAFTYNAQGELTLVSSNAVIAPASTLSGTTLAASVVNSSLTGLGTVTGGTWHATKIGLAYGGTNADLSGAGGSNFVVTQTSVGGNFASQQIAASWLSDGTTGTGNIVLASGGTLTNPIVGTQTSSDNSTKAASTAYVTSAINTFLAQGEVKQACKWATTGALAANTYNNGTSGVGATWTGNSNGALSIDGGSPAVNDRVLVKNEATQANNGIAIVTQAGDGSHPYILTRTTDFNSTSTIGAGDTTFITNGTANASTTWTQTTGGTITPGTTAIVFAQSAGPGSYTNGTGLSLTGTTFSITNTITGGSQGGASSVPVLTYNAQGQLTAASSTAVIAPAGTLSGGTLNATVLASSLTSVGTLTTGVWNATKVGLAYGGTNTDLSATGGSNQVLMQIGVGSGITVAQLGLSNISTIGSYSIVGNATNASAAPAAGQQITLGSPGYTPGGSSPIQITLTTNNYAQIGLQNSSNGSSASTDFVVTADNGNDTTHYADFGINSSVGGAAPFTAANAAYLYSVDAELDLGALGTNGSTNVYAGGGAGSPTQVAAFTAGLLTLTGTETINSGAITTNQPWQLNQTWNNSATTFTGWQVAVTNTASHSGSLVMNASVGGTSLFSLDAAGFCTVRNDFQSGGAAFYTQQSTGQIRFYNGAVVGWTNNAIATGGSLDTMMNRRGAANISLGNVDAASPVAQTISVQGVIAGTSNTAGTDLTFSASQSTGTGAGGRFVWKVAPAGTTGTAQNALANAMILDSTKLLTLSGGLTLGGNLTASTFNIVTDTSTGTIIGTATNQKLGFFNATPVVQQTGNLVTALSNLGFVTSGTVAASNLTGGTLGAGVGFTVTEYTGAGTISSGTFTPATTNGNVQKITNGGAFTLAPPSTVCSILVTITNNGSAGAITTSGFTKVNGDSFDTTNAHKFRCYIDNTADGSTLNVMAMQ